METNKLLKLLRKEQNHQNDCNVCNDMLWRYLGLTALSSITTLVYINYTPGVCRSLGTFLNSSIPFGDSNGAKLLYTLLKYIPVSLEGLSIFTTYSLADTTMKLRQEVKNHNLSAIRTKWYLDEVLRDV